MQVLIQNNQAYLVCRSTKMFRLLARICQGSLLKKSLSIPADSLQCYGGADHPKQCTLQSEDYLECLHGVKKVRRPH